MFLALLLALPFCHFAILPFLLCMRDSKNPRLLGWACVTGKSEKQLWRVNSRSDEKPKRSRNALGLVHNESKELK